VDGQVEGVDELEVRPGHGWVSPRLEEHLGAVHRDRLAGHVGGV
jgi:hypothetical protein